ncbi:MAG: CvpA family protein [Planctomycetes bacterium]|nr:CvpA family protein [Planctomycetota bacterium]
MLEGLGLNYLDVIIVAVAVLCFCLGLISGLVWQVAGIVAVIAGVAATFFLGEPATQAILRWMPEREGVASLIAHIGVFSLASFTVRMLAVVFSKMLEKWKLQKLDRLLGGAVGIVKAILICAIIVIIMDRMGTESTQESVNSSLFARPVIAVVDFVVQKADDANVTEKSKDILKKLKDAKDSLGEGEAANTGTPQVEDLNSKEADGK